MEPLILICYWAFGSVATCAWWRRDILDVTPGVVLAAITLGWIGGPFWAAWLLLLQMPCPKFNRVIWKAKHPL